MAEEDAETGLLRQLQSGQENSGWENDGIKEEDGETSNTEDKNEEEKQNTVEDTQVLRAVSPSESTTAVSDGGSYDPSSLLSLPVPAVTLTGEEQSRSSSRASSRKPRVVGGFLADDSDEEEETSTPSPSGLQIAGSTSTNQTTFPSPLHTSITQQDIASPAEQGNLTTGAPAPTVSSVTMPASSLPTVNAPKARLPHDKIGILEDRIAEDPRGDMEAWLSLISEHRGT